MANHKSAAKRARQTETRNVLNRARLSKVRTAAKKVVLAVESGNEEEARTALIKAESELARAAGRGTVHKKTASRKISRLVKQVKSMKTA